MERSTFLFRGDHVCPDSDFGFFLFLVEILSSISKQNNLLKIILWFCLVGCHYFSKYN